MLLKNFLPSPFLGEYVRFFGIVQFLFPPNIQIPQKPYSPRPENSLCFVPKDPEYITYPGSDIKKKRPQILVCGQHTELNTRHPGQDFLAFIVHFQPGVLYRLTGVPLHELTNTYADAEYVFPKEITFVNEQLCHCHSPGQMVAVVESFLIKLILQSKKQAHKIDAAARLLLQHTEHVSIDWLAKESCLCTKQFERKFKEHTGLTASTLVRIVRFDRTVKLKNAQPTLIGLVLPCSVVTMIINTWYAIIKSLQALPLLLTFSSIYRHLKVFLACMKKAPCIPGKNVDSLPLK